MKIRRINVYQVDLPIKEGCYSWADGKHVNAFDSTIVEIETEAGECGYGEVCPLGPSYLPAYATGARTGIGEIARHLIGLDANQIGIINLVMDRELLGHPYVKSAIDMACWDILGKKTGLPICELFGGRQGEVIDLYRAISQDNPEAMASKVKVYLAEGYNKFQLKVGGDANEDIHRIHLAREILRNDEVLVADANMGWLTHDALKVTNAISDLDVYIEQPCSSYNDCLKIRRHTDVPFILDESIDCVTSLITAYKDSAIDIVNLKISKVGGLTKARQIRDLCVSLNIPMTIEDSWGSDIGTAAIAHLAHSTPEKLRFSATDFNSYVSVRTATGSPERKFGKMEASTLPGLGIIPDFSVLGEPIAMYDTGI